MKKVATTHPFNYQLKDIGRPPLEGGATVLREEQPRAAGVQPGVAPVLPLSVNKRDRPIPQRGGNSAASSCYWIARFLWKSGASHNRVHACTLRRSNVVLVVRRPP